MATKRPPASTVLLGKAKAKDGSKQLVRFSYLNVHAWRVNANSGKEEASVMLMIPKANKEDIAAVQAAVKEQIEHYVDAVGKPGKEFHDPLVDGDTRTNAKGQDAPIPGHYVLTAKVLRYSASGQENNLPEVVGINRDEKGQLVVLGAKDVKSGDWGRASVNLSFYEKGKGGVGCYINSLQKVQDGEALSARKSASAEFDEFDDDDEDPLG